MKVAEEKAVRWTPGARALAEREGIDLSLLDEGVRMSLVERFEANDGALDLVLALEEGRVKREAESHGTTA